MTPIQHELIRQRLKERYGNDVIVNQTEWGALTSSRTMIYDVGPIQTIYRIERTKRGLKITIAEGDAYVIYHIISSNPDIHEIDQYLRKSMRCVAGDTIFPPTKSQQHKDEAIQLLTTTAAIGAIVAFGIIARLLTNKQPPD